MPRLPKVKTPPTSPSVTGANTLQTLLTRLTVAFARRRAYPESHPLVITAETQAFETLRAVLSEQSRMVLSIGQQELFVEGVDEPIDGSVARELADRLRSRGVGAIAFDPFVSAESLRQAIAWLAYDPSAPSNQQHPDAPTPTVLGVSINRIAYDRLTLGNSDEPDGTSSADIWRALASTAFAAVEATEHEFVEGEPIGSELVADTTIAAPGPDEIAGAIERRLAHEGYARRVAFVLLRVADQVAHAREDQRAELGERLRAVLNSLRADAMSTIIKSVGVGAEQRRFISQMIDALPANAVIEWMETAARATEHELSHHMLRLLTKLSSRSQDSATVQGAAAFRGAAVAVAHGWELDDPRPSSHMALLDHIRHDVFNTLNTALPETDAERIVQMSLEVDVFGDDAADATQALLAAGRITDLLTWTAEAPGRNAAASLRRALIAPDVIKDVLLRDPPDIASARSVLSTLDIAAADVLLNVLRDAAGRTMRRMVLDRLREFGAAAAPLYVARLNGAPWYFVRNLLGLLRDAATGHAEINGSIRTTASATPAAPSSAASGAPVNHLVSFLGHQQEQVRLEALRLLITDPHTRNVALIKALDDTSVRMVRMALETISAPDSGGHAAAAMSPELTRRVLRLIEAGAHDEDITSRAVRALGVAPRSASLRDVLIGLCTKRTLVLRRVTLADRGSVMLAALEVLSDLFAHDATVLPIIERAAEHSDRRVVDAVRKNGRTVVSAA